MLNQKRVLYVMRERSRRERTNTFGEVVMFGLPSRSYTLVIKPDTELGTVCRCSIAEQSEHFQTPLIYLFIYLFIISINRTK
jgi:hypothetical protein